MEPKKLTAEEQLAEGITWERELTKDGTKIYICKAKSCGERRSKRAAMNKHRATHGLLPIPELRKGFPSKSGDVGAAYAKKREYLERKKGTAAYKRQVAFNNARRKIKARLQSEWSSALHAQPKEDWVKQKLQLCLAEWKLDHPLRLPEDDKARESPSELEDNGVPSDDGGNAGGRRWPLVNVEDVDLAAAARQAATETLERMITRIESLKTQIPDMDVQDAARVKAACETWLRSTDSLRAHAARRGEGENCCISYASSSLEALPCHSSN